QRYWGIPIPIWQCEACAQTRVFSTIAGLNEAAGTDLADPHRPYVDSITVPCTCGGTMRRVPDIFDVWFDSAVASWATLRFPGKQEAFDSLWPADFITEGQDQTRGWFYSQLGASVIAFDRAPYKSVLMHGFALDAEGRKMSKSFGNVVAPEEVVAQYGVDVLRLYILSASAPWDDLKFNWEGLKTVNRAVNILWNVYRFPLPYMILDGFAPETAADGTWNDEYVRSHLAAMPDEDRWIISRLHSLAAAVTADIGGYQLHRATRALLACILEDISRWYVQLVRPRMWLEEDAVEKRHAYETMYSVMRMLVRLMAPFAPHIAEEIYRNLRTDADPESVHMLSWSAGEAAFVDAALEERMRIVQSFDEAVANARQAGKRKLRWPVAETVVVTGDDLVAGAVASLNDLCANRANSHAVRVVRGRWDRIGWKAEPVMRAIGPKFGKQGPVVKKLIEEADGNAVKQQIDTGGQAVIGTGGAAVTVTAEMVTFAESLPETIFSAPMPGATVYIDVALTRELESEGYAREVIRRIQEMRRQLDLRVEDFIIVAVYIADETVRGLLAGAGEEMIKDEVRAVSLALAGSSDGVEGACVRDWDVEGIAMTIAISAAPRQ
ncbi:MAG: class I tRNA ligase family protein, partial [Methanomicrobiales archaeon]|nr:class I tRNA ligase family protein [Methanomicrobiales archaeon]